MSDEPVVYRVMLAMSFRAPSPGDAVAGMVETFNERGVRNWTYRVDEVLDGDQVQFVGYFDGRGVLRELVAQPPTKSVDMPSLSTPVVEVRRHSSEDVDSLSDDADLTDYAERISSET